MANYQLYHSNVLLGGQMKYDIVLESNGQNLVASDFHITPISSSVPYNKHTKESLLLYKHRDNIAKYYKKISGHFYNNYGDPDLHGLYPIVSTDTNMDTHDDTYEMGCRRKSYQLYKKQFEFFVPLWIENLDSKCLNFEFQVFTNQKQTRPICKKNFILGKASSDFHDKLVDYFDEHFEYIGIKNGNSDVLNINPSQGIATVSGFDVETGSTRVLNIPHLLTNLFTREIPLIEFDNLIISNFSDNHLITNQLQCFNLCFNIEDILTTSLTKLVKGNPIILRLVVGLSNADGTDSVVLEKRDFYTNYEHIPKSMYGEKTYLEIDKDNNVTEVFPFSKLDHESRLNVLNYLKDYKCIQYTTINKLNPSTIHWSLVADNEYIFNAYAGFSGYYLDKGVMKSFIEGKTDEIGDSFNIYGNSYTYANSANITESKHNESLNQLVWAKHIYFIEKPDLTDTNFGYIFPLLDDLKKQATVFDGSLIFGISFPSEPDVKLCFITSNNRDKLKNMNSNRISGTYLKDNTPIFKFIVDGNTVFVVYDERNTQQLILSEFIEILESGVKDWKTGVISTIGELIRVLKGAHDSSQAITLPKSLDIVLADGPSLSTTEIEYMKNDHSPGASILRVFGKIRPTFITDTSSKHNLKYSKKVVKPAELNTAGKYIQSKFLPQFPSIGYYYLESDHEVYGEEIENIEGHSYDVGKVLCLDPSISVKLDSQCENGVYTKVDDLVKAFIKKHYDVTNEEQINYIKSLYDYTMSYDYKAVDNISDYIYDVKLELK